jgi:SAM-dependent methyltransferase
MTGAADPAARFSGRVEDYARCRPGYPAGVADLLGRAVGLVPGWIVADVGSGTGKLSEIFLARGNTLYGVEPNPEMRRWAERVFAGEARFVSVDGRAEATGLPDRSVDIVVAGQAFHWFDPGRARVEFRRILRGRPACALVWNTRLTSARGLAAAYEGFLREYSRDYLEIEARQAAGEAALAGFFSGGRYARETLPNFQVLDREEFRGRYRSCSYALAPGDARFDEAMQELDEVFDANERGGTVTIEYETTVYHGEAGS